MLPFLPPLYCATRNSTGPARHFGMPVRMPGTRRFQMDLAKLSDSERLVAEQAVLTLGALEQAAATAPHGKGLATLEGVIHDKGFEHLRNMLSVASASRPEA